MKIETVLTAKALWFVDLKNLNPRGRNLFRLITPKLQEWFGFIPPTEFDEEKGVVFNGGEFSPSGTGNDMAGVSLTIYSNGAMATCRTSSSDAESFLEMISELLVNEGIISYRTEMVTKKIYVSEVIARAGRVIVLPQLEPVYNALSNLLYAGNAQYSCTGLAFDIDPQLPVPHRHPPFRFERSVNTKVEENMWYSFAPLPTDEHVFVLEAIEEALAV